MTSEAFMVRVVASILFKKGVITGNEFDEMTDMSNKDGKTMVEVMSDLVNSAKPVAPELGVEIVLDEEEEREMDEMMKSLELLGQDQNEGSHPHLHVVDEANLEPLVEDDMDDDIEEEDCESCPMNKLCDNPKNPYYQGDKNLN
jgi:hypothetical protein